MYNEAETTRSKKFIILSRVLWQKIEFITNCVQAASRNTTNYSTFKVFCVKNIEFEWKQERFFWHSLCEKKVKDPIYWIRSPSTLAEVIEISDSLAQVWKTAQVFNQNLFNPCMCRSGRSSGDCQRRCQLSRKIFSQQQIFVKIFSEKMSMIHSIFKKINFNVKYGD